jgi:hypothetical protein
MTQQSFAQSEIVIIFFAMTQLCQCRNETANVMANSQLLEKKFQVVKKKPIGSCFGEKKQR